jgi:EAL domain-containing protein (putative c-di-GMP-specific phosphodiesterase class I)
MTDIAAAHSMLAALSDLGVGLGIDDFGTGYSSLSYLQRLPVVTLKIDRTFVTTMLSDPSNSAIVTMVLQLARTLGMGTVAEGVEDLPTLQRLAAMQCDRVQGYVIARPMPEAEFRVWLP